MIRIITQDRDKPPILAAVTDYTVSEYKARGMLNWQPRQGPTVTISRTFKTEAPDSRVRSANSNIYIFHVADPLFWELMFDLPQRGDWNLLHSDHAMKLNQLAP